MKVDLLEQKLMSVAKSLFIASLAMVSAIACGESFTPADLTTLAPQPIIEGTPGAAEAAQFLLTAVGPVETSQEDSTVTFVELNFKIVDGEQEANFRLLPETSPTLFVDSGVTVAPNGVHYTVAGGCTNRTCDTVAAAFRVYNSKTGADFTEAILFKRDGTVLQRGPGESFQSFFATGGSL